MVSKKTSLISIVGAALFVAVLVFQTGCCSLEPAAPKPKPKPAAPKPTSGCPVVGREGGNIITRQAIPTGDIDTSVILVEKIAPEVVNVGQDFEYTVKVTNLTACELDQVVASETIAQGLVYKGSTPNAAKAGSTLTWDLGTLPGNATKTLKVKAAAAGAGTFTDCVRVSYKEKLCITVKAVEPKLILDKTAPADVLICDIIPIKLTVKNPGTGPATNVVINDTLPAGLKTVEGKSAVRINVGTLAPGETKEFTVNAKATRTGVFENKAVATADGGLSDDASTSTSVKQPVLTISKTASDVAYEGRPVKYTIKVANTGSAPAAATVLTDTIPSGVKFVSASSGGQFANGVITWNFGTLAPKASKTVNVTVTAVSQGTQLNRAEVKATCASAVAASASTVVKGIPAILLEVVDIDDPIEVGGQETYVITATNQGSAPDTNITITCKLEDTQSYVSSSGATSATVTGKTIKFAPLRTLGPKAKAEWRVVIKALKAGDVRFSVQLDTDQTGRPVNETEATHQY